MNGALVQAKIWMGYGKSAQVLGSNYQFYRPAGRLELEGGGNLLLEGGGDFRLEGVSFPGTAVTTLPVSLNAEDMGYKKPNKYGKATWYALVDGTSLSVGDYFVGPQGTFFIAGMQPLLPILVVQCNRIISISRPQPQSGSGAQAYSGMTATNEIAYATNAPCSILQGTKGEKDDANLPSDVRSPWWTLLFPAAVGSVMLGDLIIDDLGQRYVASSVELTSLGYRLTAMMTDA
jgi:hypothetical protein